MLGAHFVKYCTKCLQPDTRPGGRFDEFGVCSVCEYHASLKDINWKERLLFSEHHLSHAASAFYPSAFKDAIVLTADCTQEAFNMKIGPCVSVKEQHTSLVVHKDTYMFVTPSFIKKWSGDILDGMNNPEFEQLTQKFDTFLQAGEPATPTTPKKS